MRLPAGITRSRLRQLWYMPILAVATGLMLLRMLVMARLLDVPGFATFSGALLVSSTYAMLGCLGLQWLLQRDLPVLVLRGRERRGIVLLVQCLAAAVVCAVPGIAAAAAGWTPPGLSDGQFAIGLLHGLSQQVFLLATVDSRSRGEPLRFARQNLERSLAVVVTGALAALAGGSALQVLTVEAVVSLALAAVLIRRQLRVGRLATSAWWPLAWRRVPRLPWRTSMTLLCVATVGFLLINVDRWIAVKVLPGVVFGQYAFAWIVLMMAQSLQAIVNASVYPTLARRFASDGRRAAFRIAAGVSLGALVAGAVLSLPLWWVLDHAIVRWYPDYAEARSLLPTFLGIATLRLADYWTSFLVVVGSEGRLLVLNVAASLVAAVPWWWYVRPEVHGVAVADIALLAALLTAGNYVACAVVSWRLERTA